ncbi:MAG TPA: sulfurtransferase [Candidatus Tumulicola sp.]
MASWNTVVDAASLAEVIDSPDIMVVDVRHSLADFALGKKLYDEGHLPGAFFADVEYDLAGKKTGANGRHPMPDPEQFVEFLQNLGVNEDTQIVAYDAGGDMFAARFWFLCRWIGHDAVAVLDGGIAAWRGGGFPISTQAHLPVKRGNIKAELRPDTIVDAGYVSDRLNTDAMQLLDARAEDRFAGQNEHVDPVAGHIPGARNRFFKHNYNERGLWKSPEELRAEFIALELEPELVVHQCGSGVSAAVNELAMIHAGFEPTRIYGGSWSEWIADESRPIATGKD